MCGREQDPFDPFGSFNFTVEIDGITSAGFSECTGLATETDVIEYREGDESITVKKLPGLKGYANVTLKRGFSRNTELFEWHRSVMNGVIERKDIAIILYDETGVSRGGERLRWNLQNAWPSKWVGPELKDNANEIAVETLEFCHEGITIA
ncbi:MAG: phage tail protein [Candidatus Bathyarchaeota archaeon]|jgi:phage tail-like protein